MTLRWIDSVGAREQDPSNLDVLLDRTDGFCWLDIPVWSDEAERLLRDELHCHPLAIKDSGSATISLGCTSTRIACSSWCTRRRSAEAGTCTTWSSTSSSGGTSSSPFTARSIRSCRSRPHFANRHVAERIDSGRLRPASPFGLTYAIVSTIARGESALVADLARQVGLLEQRVMLASDEQQPDLFLTELFTARHELLTIRTMASQGGEIYRRAIKLTTFAPQDVDLMRDLLDQYERVAHISESQIDFLKGVTEFYRARTDTKMTIAAERLAVIAAVTLPVTATSSVVGMNVIVNDSTRLVPLVLLIAVMATMCTLC